MNNQKKNLNQSLNWKRMCFKNNKVWAAIDKKGDLLIQNNKVLIKYNLDQGYEYKVNPLTLKPEDKAVSSKEKQPNYLKNTQKKNYEKLPDNCIKIYTDGSSTGNPGISGIGILLIYKDKKKEISKNIGMATNNIAELKAIQIALKELKRFDLPIRIFTDSNYSIKVLTKQWKAKKNSELILKTQSLIDKFFDLEFIKVKGHSGIKENEIADFFATSAAKKSLL